MKVFPKKLESFPNTSQLVNPKHLIIVQLTLNSLVHVSVSLYFRLKHNENLEKIFVVDYRYIVFCCYNSSCFTDKCLSIFVKLLLLHKPAPEKMNSIVTRKDWDAVKAIR